MPSLSAIVITKNEARNIAACLDTLAFCDEIVVVDSGSADATVQIARGYAKARVVNHPFAGFGAQKNHALSLATGEWVLSLDADERVPDDLAKEIVAVIGGKFGDAFEMPRRSTFCGRVMKHSGWWPDYVLRLFRRGTARFSDDLVHEKVVAGGRVTRLTHALDHHPVLKLEDALRRADSYSSANARMTIASGRKVSFFTGIGRGLWAFVRTYVIRLGFLDGKEGFLLAFANAEGTYYRYMKAWLAGRDRG